MPRFIDACARTRDKRAMGDKERTGKKLKQIVERKKSLPIRREGVRIQVQVVVEANQNTQAAWISRCYGLLGKFTKDSPSGICPRIGQKTKLGNFRRRGERVAGMARGGE